MALYVAIGCTLWTVYSYVEPHLFPVVEDFHITKAVQQEDGIAIWGDFNKIRDCRFVEVVGYSGDEFVSVIFNRHPKAPIVSRLTRQQSYGPWLLIPKVPQLDLYATHVCITGSVTTKLFSGAIVVKEAAQP